jgi:hypothetical protein
VIRYARSARSGANLYSLAGLPGAESRQGELNLTIRQGTSTRAHFLYLWEPSF